MDDIEGLIQSATNGEAVGDAADALLTPEQIEAIRASGKDRKPPTAKRPPDEPGESASGDDDSDDEPEPQPKRPRSRGPFAGYRKHEVEAEAERLAQRVEELERERAQESAAPNPNVLRDLAFTIEFASRIGFGSAALIRGPHWKITDEEVERIKETGVIALGPMAQEYANALPWINLASALGVPIAMRIAEDRRISKLQALEGLPDDAT
jgi:hypothetical protein